MSEFRFGRLEPHVSGRKGNRMDLSLPLPRSPRGRIQRYCPSTECSPRRFQLGDPTSTQTVSEPNRTLVRRLPKAPGVTCPYCGVDDRDEAFNAPEDIQAAKDYVKWAATEDVGDWFEGQIKGLDRIGSGVGLSALIERPRNPKPYAWREDLLRGLMCDLCGRPYGVYAIALFCPDCGGRNVHVHFGREVDLIAKQVIMSEEADAKGDEELAYRLLGNAHEDVLTALETYLRKLFLFLAKSRCDASMYQSLARKGLSGNPFQNPDRASELYKEVGVDPFRVLGPSDREFILVHISKRHVIGHNLGLADERYLRIAGREPEGASVKILGEDVRRFARIAFQIVVGGLEESELEFLPGNPSEDVNERTDSIPRGP